MTSDFTPDEQISFSWFTAHVKSGVRYALYFLGIAFVMGLVYGVFGGLVLEPGLFATSLVGIFCIINFPVSILAVLVNLVLALFKKSSPPVYRYFGLSLGFAIVYLAYFYAMHIVHVNVF